MMAILADAMVIAEVEAAFSGKRPINQVMVARPGIKIQVFRVRAVGANPHGLENIQRLLFGYRVCEGIS